MILLETVNTVSKGGDGVWTEGAVEPQSEAFPLIPRHDSQTPLECAFSLMLDNGIQGRDQRTVRFGARVIEHSIWHLSEVWHTEDSLSGGMM